MTIRRARDRSLAIRLVLAIRFIIVYFWEIVRSTWMVAKDVLTPGVDATPAVVAIPLEGLSPLQATVLANLVTMTPGTLSLDVTDDGRLLIVHGMFVGDIEAFRQGIKKNFEARVLEVLT
jgi:multicomponent Na+:H+ antiporter subunit E